MLVDFNVFSFSRSLSMSGVVSRSFVREALNFTRARALFDWCRAFSHIKITWIYSIPLFCTDFVLFALTIFVVSVFFFCQLLAQLLNIKTAEKKKRNNRMEKEKHSTNIIVLRWQVKHFPFNSFRFLTAAMEFFAWKNVRAHAPLSSVAAWIILGLPISHSPTFLCARRARDIRWELFAVNCLLAASIKMKLAVSLRRTQVHFGTKFCILLCISLASHRHLALIEGI